MDESFDVFINAKRARAHFVSEAGNLNCEIVVAPGLSYSGNFALKEGAGSTNRATHRHAAILLANQYGLRISFLD